MAGSNHVVEDAYSRRLNRNVEWDDSTPQVSSKAERVADATEEGVS